MHIYLCGLVLHENLYYASREIGRLYETERCLHNYALTYALHLARADYFQPTQVPHYAEELTPLNQRGVYVTPARGVDIAYALNTFKYASNLYHVQMEKGSRNTPSFGRAKEVAVGSVFEFAVLSATGPLTLPKWVRLGLWRSKAHLSWQEFEVTKSESGGFRAAVPVNPLDVPYQTQLLGFDIVSMPPVSLVMNAQMLGEYFKLPNGMTIPAGMRYDFPISSQSRERR
jgi:CRISPR-associated protein Csc1